MIRCRMILLAAMSALLLPGAASSGKANAGDEKGFVPLFDGKTLDGWHLMNGANFVAENAWRQSFLRGAL